MTFPCLEGCGGVKWLQAREKSERVPAAVLAVLELRLEPGAMMVEPGPPLAFKLWAALAFSELSKVFKPADRK